MTFERKESPSAWDDEALALAVQNGDRQAFEELVHRHQGRVYAVAYRMTSNREDALDVAQEAFIKAFRKIHAWRPTGSFVTWMLKVTRNQAIDHMRRRSSRRFVRLDEPEHVQAGEQLEGTGSLDTERNVRAREIDARVQKSLDVLSPTQRTVFVLRHYEGLPLADIAQVLGCTVGSVKVHLFRALKKLRNELTDLYQGAE